MMRQRWILILLFVLLFAACSPAAPDLETMVDQTAAEAPAGREEAGIVPEEVSEAPDIDAGGDSSIEFSPLSYVVPGSRLVIKDAEMELLVENTDLAIANVTQLAADSGGYIISSQTWYIDGFKHASLRLAIPVLTFEATLNTLRLFSLDVLKETASGQDVTAEYVDLESRLQNLEATAARVRAFLDAAQTVEEALTVNQQLAELEAEIEVIKGQMRFYENRAAFSTVTALLTPQRPVPTPSPTPTATPEPVWDPGETLTNASSTLVSIVQVLVDLLIWLVVVPGPFLLVIALILWVVRRVARRSSQG